MKRRRPEHVCINPDCHSSGANAKPIALGLCEACYRALRRVCKELGITTAEAAERGWCRPRTRRGSKRFPGAFDLAPVRPTMRRVR